MTVITDTLSRFYKDVDREADRLSAEHAGRLQCGRGCSVCCVDDITVYTIEAQNIRAAHSDILTGGTPHEAGKCAFLDEQGSCRIYEDRPYVCRTQGLPLRWLEERESGLVELRDICPENDSGILLKTLEPEAFWTIGPWEGRLARLQAETNAGRIERASLRSLFQNHWEGQ